MNITQFIKDYNIDRVAVIENEDLQMEYCLGKFVTRLRGEGIDVVVVNRAYTDHMREALMKAVTECQTILFESQFMYQDQVASVAKLFSKLPSKQIFGHGVNDRIPVEQGLADCLTNEELGNMSHHKLYEVEDWFNMYFEDDEDDDTFKITEIDLNKYKRKARAEELLRERKILNKVRDDEHEKIFKIRTAKGTGRMVKIKTLQSCGDEWSELKEGSVVEELDCIHFDPNPNTGVWVMGKTEPVKLLNNLPYDEWEYDNADSLAIGLEILSIMNEKANPSWLQIMPRWVNQAKFDGTNDGESHIELTQLLDTFKIPRRGYRSLIERRLATWSKTHKFFGDCRTKQAQTIERMLESLENRRIDLKAKAEAERIKRYNAALDEGIVFTEDMDKELYPVLKYE